MHCNNQKAVTDTPGQQGKIIKSTNRTKREINTPTLSAFAVDGDCRH